MHDESDERVFGQGAEWLDGKPAEGFTSSPRATGVAGRAKQFIPFAALRGFTEMVERVSRAHANIDEHQIDQEDEI